MDFFFFYVWNGELCPRHMDQGRSRDEEKLLIDFELDIKNSKCEI